jgi:DNA gyrase/topoisomerase IV subunit A
MSFFKFTEGFQFSVNLKKDMDDEEIFERFKLRSVLHENITVVDFVGHVRRMTVSDIIKEFTEYRFKHYLRRFKRMGAFNKKEYEFKKDLLMVIEKGLFKKFPNLSKKDIETLLLDNEVKEINISRIIQVPIYRFGKDEVVKLKEDIVELKKKLKLLIELCKSEDLRREEYKKDLKGIKVV